jgi:hypothetical protein
MSAWGCLLLLKWFMGSKKATYNKCQSGFSDKNFIRLELCTKKARLHKKSGLVESIIRIFMLLPSKATRRHICLAPG